MTFREQVASGIGVLRLTVDAGIALTSMVVAVPVAFLIGELGKERVQVRGQASPAAPESSTHDLGTVATSASR